VHTKNFLALGSGEAVSRVIAFGAYIYLARVFGPDGYGVLAFAAAVTLYLARVADFSIEAIGTSEIAKDIGAIPRLGGAMLGARLALAIALAVLSTVIVQFTVTYPDRSVLTLYFFTLIPVALSTKWIHMGLQDMLPISVWRVIGETTFLALAISLVEGTNDLWTVPVALLAGDAVCSAGLYLRLRLSGYNFGLRWDLELTRKMFWRAAPLTGQLLLVLLLYNMDLFFLRLFCDTAAVGYYAAAYTLITFLANIGVAYAMSILPAFAEHGAHSGEERSLYHTATAEVYAITLPIAVGGTFVASGVITVAFGNDYVPSVSVLQILVWVIPSVVLRNVPWAALIARGHPSLLFRATAFAVITNGVLNIVLINLVGLVGAAIATAIAEPLATGLMFYYAAKKGLDLLPARRLRQPTIAVVFMAAALLALGDVTLLTQLVVGGTVYFIALSILGGIRLAGGRPVLRL